jgi:alkanesulfonate monooxygenase SsuD/methylene tetrahydromethanopterin reductase-like flavin-dependent oxidoreductase (luciferase family)
MRKVVLQVDTGLTRDHGQALAPATGYRQVVDDLAELAAATDELGYWGLTQVDRSASDGGWGSSTIALMVATHLRHVTRRLRVGQFGLNLPTTDPVRLAHEIAFADQLLGGRLLLGTVSAPQNPAQRGLAEGMGLSAEGMEQAKQHLNHLAAEQWETMRSVWQESRDSPMWRETSITSSPAHSRRRRHDAASGEEVGSFCPEWVSHTTISAPSPVSAPGPPLFETFVGEVDAVRRCAEHGITPFVVATGAANLARLVEAHRAAAELARRPQDEASQLGICRIIHLFPNTTRSGELEARVKRNFVLYDEPYWRRWHAQLDAGPRGAVLPAGLGGPSLLDRLIRGGMVIGGTVDAVKRELLRLAELVPFEYLVWMLNWEMMPREEALPMIELFATEIIPELGLAADLPGDLLRQAS